MRKITTYILILLLLIIISTSAYASNDWPNNAKEAMLKANNELREYIPGSGDFFWTTGYLNDDTWREFHRYLVHGEPHGTKDSKGFPSELAKYGYRYLGFNPLGEDIANAYFRPDGKSGIDINSANWILNPASDKRVKNFCKQLGEEGSLELIDGVEGNPVFNDYIVQGLKTMATEVDPSYYKFNEAIYKDWVNYCHIVIPPTKYNSGMGRMFRTMPDGSMRYMDVPLVAQEAQKEIPNLKANAIDLGVSGTATAGRVYTATVDFKNESPDTSVSGAPVGGFNRNWPAVMLDAAGNQVTSITLLPGEIKSLFFKWQATSGYNTITGLIDTPPLADLYKEPTEADNKISASIRADAPPPPPINDRLTLQAISKGGKSAYGENLPKTKRTLNTAKWKDDVTATLTVDKPEPPLGELIEWSISSGKLTYPRKARMFAIGSPYPPEGYITVNMKTGGPGLEETKTAEVTFEEDWAMDGINSGTGAPGVYNMLDGRIYAAEPKYYPIKVDYSVTYTYEFIDCDEEGDCYVIQKTEVKNESVTANLLVNGAGMSVRSF